MIQQTNQTKKMETAFRRINRNRPEEEIQSEEDATRYNERSYRG